jgi:hypothetical protein
LTSILSKCSVEAYNLSTSERTSPFFLYFTSEMEKRLYQTYFLHRQRDTTGEKLSLSWRKLPSISRKYHFVLSRLRKSLQGLMNMA